MSSYRIRSKRSLEVPFIKKILHLELDPQSGANNKIYLDNNNILCGVRQKPVVIHRDKRLRTEPRQKNKLPLNKVGISTFFQEPKEIKTLFSDQAAAVSPYDKNDGRVEKYKDFRIIHSQNMCKDKK